MITIGLKKTEIMNNFGDLFDLTPSDDEADSSDMIIEIDEEDYSESPELEGQLTF